MLSWIVINDFSNSFCDNKGKQYEHCWGWCSEWCTSFHLFFPLWLTSYPRRTKIVVFSKLWIPNVLLWTAKHSNIDNNSVEDALSRFMCNTCDSSFCSIVFKHFFFPFQMILEKKFSHAFDLSLRKEQFVFEINYQKRDWNGPDLIC